MKAIAREEQLRERLGSHGYSLQTITQLPFPISFCSPDVAGKKNNQDNLC